MGTIQSAPKSLLFIGLSAYGAIGGMQKFNQCVLRALTSIAECSDSAKITALFLSDPPRRFKLGPINVEGFGRSRMRLLRRFATVLAHPPQIFLIGHIDLIPMGIGLKLLHPGCRQILFVHGVEAWGESRYRNM